MMRSFGWVVYKLSCDGCTVAKGRMACAVDAMKRCKWQMECKKTVPMQPDSAFKSGLAEDLLAGFQLRN
ncbi:hypothetical protein ASF04_22095 [Duganella sp. Leaf61]|uniref:hypothetical protein n=1 Tax=Duganella sp. Leaf61 TaxID=1736227 RepID=UPI0006F72AD6|nr:hypothetical protein [Duganella sp. Leaf61]KQN78713.1 hypothetical protein ASF04_22095 [Duganella sp. Leaf61]